MIGDEWFFLSCCFNRKGMTTMLGMSKQKHLKVLIKNENEELKVVPGKTKMLHIFASPMVV